MSLYVIPQEPKVRGALRRLGVVESDIDDLIQDGYCSLATLKSVDHIDRPGAYFMQIVKNGWRDGLRRARVVRLEDFTENTTSIVEDDATGVEATIFAREQLGLIEALLVTLPERCRTIFTWKRMEGVPQREIARRLGVRAETRSKPEGYGRGEGYGGEEVGGEFVVAGVTAGATNLAGTRYETGVDPVAHAGVPVAGITPVRTAELIDMLNPVQLRRLGMNLDTLPSTPTTLSEKQEAMGLLPALDPDAPNDYFLLIGKDNDFEAKDGFVDGIHFNASLDGPHGTGANDNVVLVYRLTLPPGKAPSR